MFKNKTNEKQKSKQNKKANKTKSTGRYGCIFQMFYEEIKPIVYHKEKERQVKTIGI